jgi:hypothetical protein
MMCCLRYRSGRRLAKLAGVHEGLRSRRRSELHSVDLAVSKPAPKLRFCLRWVAAHHPCESQLLSRRCPGQERPIVSSSSSHVPGVGQRQARLRKIRHEPQSPSCQSSPSPDFGGRARDGGLLEETSHSQCRASTTRGNAARGAGVVASLCKYDRRGRAHARPGCADASWLRLRRLLGPEDWPRLRVILFRALPSSAGRR